MTVLLKLICKVVVSFTLAPAAPYKQQPDVSVVVAEEDAGPQDRTTVMVPVRRRWVTASGRPGLPVRLHAADLDVGDVGASMVPLALVMVQTWAGLVGWVLTRTW